MKENGTKRCRKSKGQRRAVTQRQLLESAAIWSAAACCRFLGGCWLPPACWRLTFRAPNSGIPGCPQPATQCGLSKLHVWRIPQCKAAASCRTPNTQAS